jgi:hypothetical protein
MPTVLWITLLLTVALLGCGVAPARGEFVLGSAYSGAIRGESNTLRSLAENLNRPDVLRMEGAHTLLCMVSVSLQGQLEMGPQDRLVTAHPHWGRRFVNLSGQCQWRDCAVEGANWVDAGNSVTGFWNNVTIRAGETRGYPVVWFRSRELTWDGGLVDCFPKDATPAPVGLGTRGGYSPGPFQNTLRNVTFRVATDLIEDKFAGHRHDLELTLERCIIETTGKHTARIVTEVNATDACASVITLRDCIRRHNGKDAPASTMLRRGEVRVLGTASRVRFVENGQLVAEVRRKDATEARLEPGNLRKTLEDALQELGPRVQALSAQARLRGTLCYARTQLDDLNVMREGLAATGRYAAADKRKVEAALAQARDTLRHAEATLRPGSPFAPKAAPLDRIAPGEATLTRREDGCLVARTAQSVWVYTPNESGKRYATFLPESQVRGRPILGGAHPEYGGPSVRNIAPADSGTMLWEFPWQARITQARGPLVGFETTLRTGPEYGCRATWVFFHDLPEVILCNVRGFQPRLPGKPLQNNVVRVQAYALSNGDYNGIRLWNQDPNVAPRDPKALRPGMAPADAYEPEYGFFCGESPWYVIGPSRGLLLAQWNGRNDWRRSPPCGFLFRAEQMSWPWVGTGGYYTLGGHAERKEPARDEDDLNTQVLWFEGAGLKCWENLYNLEAAFSRPCQPLLDLTEPGRAALKLWERAGIARQIEIVTLPAAYGAAQSDRTWYRGDVCVTLLRDVAAGGEVAVGTLPVACERTSEGFRLTNQAGTLRDLWLRLPGAVAGTVTINGKPATETVRGDGWIAVRADLMAGENRVTIR